MLCKVFSAIRELVDIVKKNSRVGDSGSGVGQGRSPCSRTTINPLSRGAIFPSLSLYVYTCLYCLSLHA